jgi:N-acetylmuramoyl-L-alanine amidase
MSKPMTATQMESQLKKFGIKYVAYKSWSTHNRGDRGNGFSDLNGLVLHHTGSDGDGQEGYLYTGTEALPGPLCHWGMDNEGVLHLIGWGRANHAGGGDPNVLNHVINEDYTGTLKPKFGEGDSGSADGNGHFYGVEIYYSGSHKMTDDQYLTAIKLGAAVCDFHGWSYKSVIAHGEWSNDKWDPGVSSNKMMDMVQYRNDLAVFIKDKKLPGSTTTSKGTTVADSTKPATKSTTYKEVWESDSMASVQESNPFWNPGTFLQQTYIEIVNLQKSIAELTAAVNKLTPPTQ